MVGVSVDGPRVLTPEQKRGNATRRQRVHRRKQADREWSRATNSGRIIYLEVLHWLDLLEFLVALKVLALEDVENPPAIEDAVGEARTGAREDTDPPGKS